jgi:adenylyl cyclase-associated protein
MANLSALLDGFAARLDVVEKALSISGNGGGGGGGGGGGAAAEEVEEPASLKAYDAFSKPSLDAIAAACAAIGGADAAAVGALIAEGWAAQRRFLVVAAACKKPADKGMAVLKSCGVVDACQAASKAVKRGPFELHYKMVAEGLGALNWLLVEPKPREVIENQLESVDFNANKIRLEFKRNTDKFDANQHALCDAFKKLFVELQPYTKAHHLTGVAWNFKGVDAAAYTPPAPGAQPAASAAAAAAPAAAKAAAPAGGLADLKSELKIDNAASGLKKVTKDMQTWRAEFKGGEAPTPVAPKVAPRVVVVKTKGTKQCEFKTQGQRWCVEAQTKEDGVIEVTVLDVKHSVAIYGCFGATIDIKGKCKGVTVDSCEQTKVLIDTAISAVELVNCKRMQIQVREKVPTVAIDKTDGCLTYLSAQSLDTVFTTAKSSEMNVAFPNPKSADGELIETPIPEQFVHKVLLDGPSPHMSAEVSELYSH